MSSVEPNPITKINKHILSVRIRPPESHLVRQPSTVVPHIPKCLVRLVDSLPESSTVKFTPIGILHDEISLAGTDLNHRDEYRVPSAVHHIVHDLNCLVRLFLIVPRRQ